MQRPNLHIVIEKNIPFIKGLLEQYGTVEYLAADEFTPQTVKDADALIVRTRTRCDASLLQGSKVRFVATATIGTDHIDLDWCQANGITVANAPGCNAPGVAQYVLSSVHHLCDRPLSQCTIGIVGVGHVGSIVESWARQLGMNVMLNDPPREAAEGGEKWSTLTEIAEKADIITLHTPLDETTHHMVDTDFLASLKRTPILINAARGPIVDTEALIAAKDAGAVKHVVIDCWEHEPEISRRLLDICEIATPHIAGYSYEGKVRATRMAVDALCDHFGLDRVVMPEQAPEGAAETVTAQSISDSYDPMVDTAALKAHPEDFEALRNHYAYRHETGVISKP